MKDAGRGRYLSELRRSNAAGLHASRPSRSQIRRTAIEEELMSEMAVEIPAEDEDFDNLAEVGPSDDDIAAMSDLERELMADKEVFDRDDYIPGDPYDDEDDLQDYDDDEYYDRYQDD